MKEITSIVAGINTRDAHKGMFGIAAHVPEAARAADRVEPGVEVRHRSGASIPKGCLQLPRISDGGNKRLGLVTAVGPGDEGGTSRGKERGKDSRQKGNESGGAGDATRATRRWQRSGCGRQPPQVPGVESVGWDPDAIARSRGEHRQGLGGGGGGGKSITVGSGSGQGLRTGGVERGRKQGGSGTGGCDRVSPVLIS